MFRKIRSNRAPDRTVPVELYHEFRPYLVLIRRRMVRLLKAYPRQVFTLMVTVVVFSVVFSFGLFPLKNKKESTSDNLQGKKESQNPSYSVGDGLSKISTTGAKLRKTLEIRKQVDSVLSRGTLNNADSVFLGAKLEELKKLH
jgi:hypothetical protein